jgi:hypothetical protein
VLATQLITDWLKPLALAVQVRLAQLHLAVINQLLIMDVGCCIERARQQVELFLIATRRFLAHLPDWCRASHLHKK